MNGSGSGIRVLYVDDEPERRAVVATHLERDREAITVQSEATVRDGLARLADEQFDCIVSDHGTAGVDGLALLRNVRDRHPGLPFVLFPGEGSEAVASEAISAGVSEYLRNDGTVEQYTALADRIEGAVSESRSSAALERQESRLSTLVSNLPGMVYRCRNERGWPMTFVSEGARELTGYDPAAIENGTVDWEQEVIVPSDRESLWRTVQSALADDEPFEVTYRIETADGDERWVWERGRRIAREAEVDIIEGFITDITPRKERERELERQRTFTENVLNSLEDLFYVVEPDGTMRRWNDRVCEVTGHGDDEVEGLALHEFVAPGDEETVRTALRDAIDGESARFEAAVETATEGTVPFEFHATALHEGDGDLLGVAGVARDISERKARERSLRQYKTLTENVADPMYVMNPDGTIEMVNEALAEHLGYDRAEIVGRRPDEFVVGDGVEQAESLIAEMLSGERKRATFEMDTRDSAGEITHNETKITVITDDDGTFQGTAGVVRDITGRKERERDLERYETIVQAVGDPVYTLDDEGVFRVVNDAMESLSGYDRGELVGEHISTIMTDADVAEGERLIADLLADPDRANGTFEMDVLTADGRRVPCENHVALLPSDDGDFRGTAGVIRDITERKQREKQLEQFASVVSHDLRSPLNVVQGRVEHVRSTGDLAHLDDAADAAARMERLIDDLLTLAHEGQRVSDLAPVAVDVVARAAWEQLDAGGATLAVETERQVEADFNRLQELFDNLFCNALAHGDADTVRVVGTEDGFAVADDGTGIPPDRRDSVFERGFTTSEDGTGFGLAIVETIVQAHDWTISAGESASGGARFEIET